MIVTALPSAYRAYDDRRTVLADEEKRLSRAAERIERLLIDQNGDADAQAHVAAFNRTVEFVMPQGGGASAALASREGTFLARLPEPELFVGKSLLQDQAFLTHRAAGMKQTAGVYTRTLTGAPRLIVGRSFRQVADPPFVIFVTRDLSEALAAWRRRASLEAGQFACFAAVILIFAGMAARREGRLRQTAAAVAEREALYHSLFQGNKAVKLLLDPTDGALADVNAAACAYYGYDRDTLLKMKVSDINTLSREEIAAEMAAAKAERRAHFFFRHRLASGEIRDVEVHSGPVQYQGRQLLYSIIHDVTDRKRLEAERARLFTAIEQSQASIVITDTDGVIRYVNPAFTRISGYAGEEIIGQNPRILKSGHTTDDEYKEMWAQLTAGLSCAVTFLNKTKSGDFYWEHAQISPVRDENGAIVNYVAVKENITELKKAEDDLKEANAQLAQQAAKLQSVNAELEQFAYVASHDLRQPLRAISSYLQLIDKNLKDADADTREFLGYAVAGAQRMDRLIIGLLEYSRIGRTSRGFAAVTVGDLVAVSLQTYAVAVLDAGATVTVAADLPTVWGDAVELQRLFDNLLGNALKYRAPDRPPEISIGGTVADDRATLWVADNGVGMDPKDHERVFAMFQRLTATGDRDGAGIGLAVCKKIVERHRGGIRIDSAVDAGCRFIIDLPTPPAADRTTETH